MVQLEAIGDAAETLQELVDLGKRTTQLDQRHRWERSQRVHVQHALLLGVQVAHDQEKIAGGLDGQETASWHVDAQSAIERLNGSARSWLELDDVQAPVSGL